jgi:hypothetical protein
MPSYPEYGEAIQHKEGTEVDRLSSRVIKIYVKSGGKGSSFFPMFKKGKGLQLETRVLASFLKNKGIFGFSSCAGSTQRRRRVNPIRLSI